jgi:hypothetical protein
VRELSVVERFWGQLDESLRMLGLASLEVGDDCVRVITQRAGVRVPEGANLFNHRI